MIYNYIYDLEGAESIADSNPDTDAVEEEVEKNQLERNGGIYGPKYYGVNVVGLWHA